MTKFIGFTGPGTFIVLSAVASCSVNNGVRLFSMVIAGGGGGMEQIKGGGGGAGGYRALWFSRSLLLILQVQEMVIQLQVQQNYSNSNRFSNYSWRRWYSRSGIRMDTGNGGQGNNSSFFNNNSCCRWWRLCCRRWSRFRSASGNPANTPSTTPPGGSGGGGAHR